MGKMRPVFYFASITVAVHGFVIFGLGRLFKLEFGTLAVASQACVGGAVSAAAMASARGYMDRLLPRRGRGALRLRGGVLVQRNFGYVLPVV